MNPIGRSIWYWLALLIVLVISAAHTPASQEVVHPRLVVHIEGVRSTSGTVRLGFYESAERWASEKSNFQRPLPKVALRNGRMSVVLHDVPPGQYGIAVVDDENDSGLIDWGLLMPKEGFGFSNYYHRSMSRPRYEDFSFEHNGDKTEVTIRLRYL